MQSLTADWTGTSYILDEKDHPHNRTTVDSSLKYDRSGPEPIILVPQPSEDPNDPLVCCKFLVKRKKKKMNWAWLHSDERISINRTGHDGSEMPFLSSCPSSQCFVQQLPH